jgi:nitrate reductase NapE component
MSNSRKNPKARVEIPAPPQVSTWRYFIGRLFGSIQHWPKLFVAFFGGLGFLICVIRARTADMPKLARVAKDVLDSTAIVGWITAACVLLFSIVTVLIVIWRYGVELDRVAKERDECQEKLMDQKVQRSR